MNIWQYVQTLDIDQLSRSFREAQPFPHLCVDNFLVDEFADQVWQSYPSYEQAANMGRSFRAVNERGKVQVTDASLFPSAVKSLHDVLSSPEFLGVVSKITGIPDLIADESLVGGGIHQTGPRGHLDVHVDFNYLPERQLHRRLNILVFFNKNWQPAWGGKLELWDRDVKRCYHSILPEFNRCVIFATSEISFHGVTAVTCPPEQTRKSFAAYYYTECEATAAAPTSHSTIFRARPQEHWKRWISMPLEHASRAFRRSTRRLKSALGKHQA